MDDTLPHIFEGYVPPEEGNLLCPCFNPVNTNGFVYVFDNYTEKFSSINFVDFRMCKVRQIYKGPLLSIISPISLNQFNEVIFETAPDMQIQKISLTNPVPITLTTSGHFNNYCTWNPQGNRIAWQKVTYSPLTPEHAAGFLIMDGVGKITDTIFDIGFYKGAWGKNDLMAVVYKKIDVALINLRNREIMQLTHNVMGQWSPLILCVQFSRDNKRIYYSTISGIFEIDINTNMTRLVRSTTFNCYYNYFSIAPDDSYFLAEKVIIQQDVHPPIMKSLLVKFDLNSSDEYFFRP